MTVAEAEAALRTHALSYPEAWEDHPWGSDAFKVRKKIFYSQGFYDSDEGRVFSLSMKLPDSKLDALALPFTEPSHYGMGKHGWVTSRFPPGSDVPVEILRAWIDESYRVVAPKKLVKLLDAS